MIEEVKFKDTDMSVKVQIDNENKELPIKEIIKLDTNIKLNQSLDTAYLDDIVVDATLYYINDNNESKPLNIDGFVTIYLSDISFAEWVDSFSEKCYQRIIPVNENIPWLDENNNPVETDIIKTVIQECVIEGKPFNTTAFTVQFKKGHIKTTIPNNLPIDSYVLSFEYLGNKYFNKTYYESNFFINKRLVSCTFDSNIKNAYPKEKISFYGILKDAETKKILTNTNVRFIFDNNEYTTSTNAQGEFSINVTLPDADISHCVYEIDDINNRYEDDGHTYPGDMGNQNLNQTSYPIDIYLDNESYYLPSTQIHANVKKLPTETIMSTANCNDTSNIMQIDGSIISKDDNAHYGHVAIEFPEMNYKHQELAKVKQDGGFSINIDLKTVYNIYNNNTTSDMEKYDITNDKATAITLSGDNTIEIGETFVIEGTVKASGTKEIVVDGMLVFTVYKKENDIDIEVYKYATELDNTGVAVLTFNTSKENDYFIKAKYYGMFGYQNSTSGEHKVEVRG